MNENTLMLIVQYTTSLCVFAIFLAILIDFIILNKRAEVKKEKKSIVETGTMTLFFCFYYLLLFPKWAVIGGIDQQLKYALIITGTLMIVFGCVMNILGRIYLGTNWANQIKIYQAHELILRGPYKIVRHPLYASIMLMFYGGVILFRNYMNFISVSFIFIPFMFYRAKQEEKLLLQTFPLEYPPYKKRVGMFFPKFQLRKVKKGPYEIN